MIRSAPTNPRTRAALQARWEQIADELDAITAHRIVPERQRLTDVEIALMREQDAIEFQLGTLDFEECGGLGESLFQLGTPPNFRH